jgi:hypothetical protein
VPGYCSRPSAVPRLVLRVWVPRETAVLAILGRFAQSLAARLRATLPQP